LDFKFGPVSIQLGFAGVLGALLNQLRGSSLRWKRLAGISLGALVFVPLTLVLPFPAFWQCLLTLLALNLFVLYTLHPPAIPDWLWSPGFGWRYAGFVMGLILVWSLSDGHTPEVLLLGLLAALAGTLAWLRGVNFVGE
jgi:hypothetical protein